MSQVIFVVGILVVLVVFIVINSLKKGASDTTNPRALNSNKKSDGYRDWMKNQYDAKNNRKLN